MKKIQILFVILLTLVMVSCMDQEAQDLSTPTTHNTGTLTCDDHDHGPVEKGFFTGKVAVGHKASDCNNSCVYANGKPGHIDCQSFGKECTYKAKFFLEMVEDGIYMATTINADDLTPLEFFFMPDRSIFVGLDEHNNEQWINIPKQHSVRDHETNQFIFKEVFITDQQFYPNI
ncbi:MAG: hypothetical protein RBS29_09765 [Bacteroidales bacterium]|nr:hypothetical protein [Bacteroidales bacterium]